MGSSSVSKLYLCLWSQALILWTKPYSTDYALKRQTVINSCTLRRCFPADVGENWWWDYRLTCFNPCTTSAFDSFLLSLLIFVCTCHRTQSITANTQNQTMRITVTVQFLTFSFLSTMWAKYITNHSSVVRLMLHPLFALIFDVNWYFISLLKKLFRKISNRLSSDSTWLINMAFLFKKTNKHIYHFICPQSVILLLHLHGGLSKRYQPVSNMTGIFLENVSILHQMSFLKFHEKSTGEFKAIPKTLWETVWSKGGALHLLDSYLLY